MATNAHNPQQVETIARALARNNDEEPLWQGYKDAAEAVIDVLPTMSKTERPREVRHCRDCGSVFYAPAGVSATTKWGQLCSHCLRWET